MKKLFPEEKDKKSAILEFLDKKGFYIVLILCIAIIGGTAVYVTTRSTVFEDYGEGENIAEDIERDKGVLENIYDSEGQLAGSGGENADTAAGAQSPEQQAASQETGDSDIAGSPASATDSETENIGEKAGTSDTKVAGAKTPETGSGESSIALAEGEGAAAADEGTSASGTAIVKADLSMPVFGEITYEYAMDKLAYSKTLEEWRAHPGLDISADLGDQVKAVADGVVTEIKNDPRYGITVVLDHQNGLKTVYANLASDDTVAVNQIVKQGDIIGSIGDTAVFESSEQSHLHFEVLLNGVRVNPADYLPAFFDQKE